MQLGGLTSLGINPCDSRSHHDVRAPLDEFDDDFLHAVIAVLR